MSQRNARLCRGDLVEVKTPDEIVQTLDPERTSDDLPFMPEMLRILWANISGLQASIDDMLLGTGPLPGVQGR